MITVILDVSFACRMEIQNMEICTFVMKKLHCCEFKANTVRRMVSTYKVLCHFGRQWMAKSVAIHRHSEHICNKNKIDAPGND